VHSRTELATIDISRQFNASQEAVLAIGTNAIPTLLELLQARDSSSEKSRLFFVQRQPSLRNRVRTAREKHDMAQAGFMILQKGAMPAVPDLIKLTRHKVPQVRLRAFEFLVIIVSPDMKSLVPVLVPFGHDPDPENRRNASKHMQTLLFFLSPDEAQAAGVYEAFPELRNSNSISPLSH